jgi:ATPase subunit of ABC transporter with duplicated ATPase domains
VITSHDQDFLDNVVEETIYIRDQQLRHFDGTPTALQVEAKKKMRRMKTMSEAMDKKKEHVSGRHVAGYHDCLKYSGSRYNNRSGKVWRQPRRRATIIGECG